MILSGIRGSARLALMGSFYAEEAEEPALSPNPDPCRFKPRRLLSHNQRRQPALSSFFLSQSQNLGALARQISRVL